MSHTTTIHGSVFHFDPVEDTVQDTALALSVARNLLNDSLGAIVCMSIHGTVYLVMACKQGYTESLRRKSKSVLKALDLTLRGT